MNMTVAESVAILRLNARHRMEAVGVIEEAYEAAQNMEAIADRLEALSAQAEELAKGIRLLLTLSLPRDVSGLDMVNQARAALAAYEQAKKGE